ncbi:protein MALE DISCOVERER 2 isoform X1 [Populus alba x Populus x berolinensis]|nr:protein MALE DISCOVERER 2 isoform X1 [Populus alba x Populus x berolinensis]
MRGRWNSIGFRILFFLVLTLSLENQCLWSLTDEGSVLLKFRARVDFDPFGALANWNPNDIDPCSWTGVHCVAGKVQILDLSGLSLEGTLAPELGKLVNLRSLVLYRNHFTGTIPKEIGELKKLELLDLRNNNFSGAIPEEIGRLLSLKYLLLRDNKFEGSIPPEIRRLDLLYELQFDGNLASGSTTGVSCVNRKLGHGTWWSSLNQLNGANSFIFPIKGAFMHYLNSFMLQPFKLGKDALHGIGENCFNEPDRSSEQGTVQNVEIVVNFERRRLLEQSSNLQAAPAIGGSSSQPIIALPTTRSSGSFPAIPNAKKHQAQSPVSLDSPVNPPPRGTEHSSHSSEKPSIEQPPTNGTSGNTWMYFLIIPIAGVVGIVAVGLLLMCRKQVVTTIGPWKTGLSGQLQKAFVTGVPKLNRSELETACEDFSNIIDTFNGFTAYKGTLSSGVEISVASTAVTSSKDWSKSAEMAYRKKIETLSRINHKNFVNLIGYCEEDEPFNRMMVFEYAPNGSLFEHLHVEEMEHLDWNTRLRIIMGVAYCLQYMHHDLNPPIVHSKLCSRAIFLTDDYAAKIAEICFLPQATSNSKISGEMEDSLPPHVDLETNVYCFGVLLLEVISGKLSYSEEQGHLENWAAEYLNDKRSIGYMIDPSLKSFKNNELDVICEVIQQCIQSDPRYRPTMKEITSKLKEVISISPDQATPRLSPLWWAELEILSVEAT